MSNLIAATDKGRPLALLANYPNFVICAYWPKDKGGLHKAPVHPATLIKASRNDPSIWLSRADAAARLSTLGRPNADGTVSAQNGKLYGLGFVVRAELGFAVVDLDACRNPATGAINEFAQGILARFPQSAVTASISGTGLHVWLWHTGAKSGNRRGEGLEIYSADWFLAESGNVVQGDNIYDYTGAIAALVADLLPAKIDNHAGDALTDAPREGYCELTDDELIEKACGQRQTAAQVWGRRMSFGDLWHADVEKLKVAFPDTKEPYYNASSAEQALACHLAFWCGGNGERVLKLMHQSRLAALRLATPAGRKKWARKDYLPGTVAKACAGLTEIYRGRSDAGDDGPPLTDAQAVELYEAEFRAAGNAPELIAAADKIKADKRVSPLARELLRDSLYNAAHVRLGLEWRKPTCAAMLKPKVDHTDQFVRNANNGIRPMQANVTTACRAGDFSYDEFKSVELFNGNPLTDNDLTFIVETVEATPGFPEVSRQLVKHGITRVAMERRFDSAIERVGRAVWDQSPRLAQFWQRIYGVEDTPYVRALGPYLFTGMAGRVIKPGCKLDAGIVMFGHQMLQKSTFVEALALEPDWYGEIDFNKKSDDLARLLMGKVITEWPEKQGSHKVTETDLKQFMTRRTERWVPKHVEHPKEFSRRNFVIVTTNEHDSLNFEGEERRWNPITVKRLADLDWLAANLEQLWAEGAALYRVSGVAWQDVEKHAPAERDYHRRENPLSTFAAALFKIPVRMFTAGADNPLFEAAAFTQTEAQIRLKQHLPEAPSPKPNELGPALRAVGFKTGRIWDNDQKKQVRKWFGPLHPKYAECD